jgi:hypothetical protein
MKDPQAEIRGSVNRAIGNLRRARDIEHEDERQRVADLRRDPYPGRNEYSYMHGPLAGKIERIVEQLETLKEEDL